jgi:hypothetical protein
MPRVCSQGGSGTTRSTWRPSATIQRQGIGSLIMQEHCRRLDAASEVGYLETDKPENVRFYERLGFEVTGDEPVIGVPNWFMRRPPVSDAGP